MAKSLREARGSLMADIETLNDLLHSLGEGWERGQGCGPGYGALGEQIGRAHV